MEFIARATLPTRFHVYQLQHTFMFILQGPDLDHDDGRVEFNSAQLASSTIANDYFDFVRMLAYASLATTTTCRIRLRLVGFINNCQRLLDFVKNARQHAGDYFDYSFCLDASRNRLCLAIRERLHRPLVSLIKLVGIDSD
jgi:hypothetical protein